MPNPIDFTVRRFGNGERLSVAQLSRRLGVPYTTLREKVRSGREIEELKNARAR